VWLPETVGNEARSRNVPRSQPGTLRPCPNWPTRRARGSNAPLPFHKCAAYVASCLTRSLKPAALLLPPLHAACFCRRRAERHQLAIGRMVSSNSLLCANGAPRGSRFLATGERLKVRPRIDHGNVHLCADLGGLGGRGCYRGTGLLKGDVVQKSLLCRGLLWLTGKSADAHGRWCGRVARAPVTVGVCPCCR
jgi:hypothetical protein